MVRRSSTVSDAPTRLDEYLSSQEGVKMPTKPLPDVNQGSVTQLGTYPVKTILYSQGLPVARRVLPSQRLDTTSLAANAGPQGNGRVQVPRLSLAVPRTSSSLSLDAPSARRGSLESLDCEEILNEYLRGLRRMLATGKHRVSASQQDFFESRAERLHESLSRRLGKIEYRTTPA
ncbi:hypothetical protein FOZ60_016813 [Perkinsus olseni]|uniref:Uncharacterized protein n=1 Tax=Perkinsus olseni TaxID=32597 RepID=A0A7J6P659_PEROL|nr:hypothetical protein FOZ60_016813 [Perkinsus olseni]